MANWEKLNKEFDDALNSMTKEDWDNWYVNVEMKRINQNKMKKTPTAEDFLQDHLEISHFYDDKTQNMVCYSDDVQKAMIEFAKLHVDAALKVVEEKQSKLEQLATLLQSAWTNGDWKAETPNEHEMEKIMVELGYWGDKNNGDNPGDTMTMMSPTDLENERFFKTEASDYNPLVREKDHPATIENTIPMEMGSNYASLDTVTFKFIQDANCVDGPSDEIEELIVEAKSSLGIDADGGAFFVLKTKQWAIDDANEMFNLLKRCENSINAIVGK